MTFQWNTNLEEKALDLKSKGITLREISIELGTTISSIKHKIRRLQQKQNLDRYKHTIEKKEQMARFIPKSVDLAILETHAGFGCMTEFYSEHGQVTSIELKEERVNEINSQNLPGVTTINGDCERLIFNHIVNKDKYDIIDIDPYGYPSRLFPHIFSLMTDGIMVITLPMIGVAQMNKLTIAHLKVFWGVDYRDKETYIDKVLQKLKDYGYMYKNKVDVLEVSKFDRIYRIVIKVKKTSLNEIVGLKVNR